MVDERGRDKNQICNGGRRAENEMRDNYQFILSMRASHFRSVSKTIPIPEDLGHRATGELVTVDVAILMRRENFSEKFSITLGFLSGVIAFCSSLIVTMTWLHCSAPLGLSVNVSSFPLMLSLIIPAATLIVALAVLKNGLLRISGV
jgi:hypothetical protein